MATTLTHGRIKPSTGDRGNTVFTALETNIDLDDSHDHDGTDSSRINTYNLTRAVVAVPNTGWVSGGNGLFKQTVTFPAGYSTLNGSDWGKAQIRFFVNTGTYDKQEFFPKTVYLTATTFELYFPANNQAIDVLFM